MKKLLIATALTLGASCGVGFAQSSTEPAGTVPRTMSDSITASEATGTAGPRGDVAPARPLNDPNTTGPDKMNGLEVPQMKGEPPAPR